MKKEFDATNESLGRLASRVAVILRGKDKTSYEPNELPKSEVFIKNLHKAKFTGNKLNKKIYYSYSGYHSGITARKLSDLWKDRPQHVFRQMVLRMLPKNKLRAKIIKNLRFQ